MECWEARLNAACEAEHALVRMGLAAVQLWVQTQAHQQADNDNDSIACGADEPDNLVQDKEALSW